MHKYNPLTSNDPYLDAMCRCPRIVELIRALQDVEFSACLALYNYFKVTTVYDLTNEQVEEAIAILRKGTK